MGVYNKIPKFKQNSLLITLHRKVMGNGCLKPTPRTGQIYIDCINKIYEQVKQLQSFEQKNESDIYSYIKQKVQKKGWLRKLMDNLTSHRQSISQAALHNFRLMAQSKGTEFKITGLIVIDYIIGAVLRQSGLQVGEKLIQKIVFKLIIKQKDINAQSQYQQSQGNKRDSFAKRNAKSNQSNNNVLYTAPSLHNIENNDESNSAKNYLSYLNNNSSLANNQSSPYTNLNQSPPSLMFRQIYNVKFSNIFFNMIHSLISSQDAIYTYGVKSIITYMKYHNVKNIQQQKILELLQILLEHVQTGEQVNLSLNAYEVLIKKLRDTFMESQLKHFKTFLKIWLEVSRKTNDQENSFHFKDITDNKMLLESIIHKMISSMIGTVGITKVYEQILSLYDQQRFQNMVPFQEMLIAIMKRDELKSQFFRGLYSFLLAYFAVCKNHNVPAKESMKSIQSQKQIQGAQQNDNSNSLIVKKWPCINCSKTYEQFLAQYENILMPSIKPRVITTLKRWTSMYSFIQINELIKYNSSLMLNSFLFNIHETFLSPIHESNFKSHRSIMMSQSALKNKNSLTARELMIEFCKQFCHEAQIQQRVALINLLFDEIRSPNSEIQTSEKLLYLQMVNQLIYEEWIESAKLIEFCHLDSSYLIEINHQLLNIANILVNKFTQKFLIKEIDHLCYFMFSIFELLSHSALENHQRCLIVNTSIKLVQTIQRSYGALIVLPFTQRMIKAINSEMEKNCFWSCWDLTLNCSYVLISSPRNLNRQSMKRELNQIYIKITLNEQLKNSVSKITESEFDEKVQKILLDTFSSLSQEQQDRQIISVNLPRPQDFQNAKVSAGPHQKIYQLASIAFRDMFSRGVSRAKGDFFSMHQEQTSFQAQTGGFTRANSIIHEDDLGHEQKSIADVVDMIYI